MAELLLIRHARASAQGADYDVLQADGEEQARLLGAHLGATHARFDALYVGPHRRQQDTLRIARDAAGEMGRAWPEPMLLPDLAEAPHDAIVKKYLPQRLGHDAALDAQIAALSTATDKAARDAIVGKLVFYALDLWRRGELAGDDLESWPAFQARVDATLELIRRQTPQGACVAAFTSYVVIDRMLQVAGSAPQGRPMHLIFNTSRSRLALRPSLAALDVSCIDHLAAHQRTLY